MNQELIGYISQTQELNGDIREGGILEIYDLEYDIKLIDYVLLGYLPDNVNYLLEKNKVKKLLDKIGGLT